MLTIRLFGTGQAQYNDQSLDGFPHHRAMILLCYLLLNHAYPHPREKLAATFWVDFPAKEARKQLRNALWKLRQVFQSVGAEPDEYLQISDDSVSFIPSSQYWLDAGVFEEIFASCQDLPAEGISNQQAAQLEKAAKLYTGDLLEGVYEDWCIYEREFLRLHYLAILNKLLVYYGINGDYERSLIFGKRVLLFDNTLERVHRQVMSIEWLRGDRGAALAQYKLCRQIIRDELGVEPMEETRKLYEKILNNQILSPELLLEEHFYTQPRTIPADLPASLGDVLLHRLHQMQEAIEKTNTELHNIERLIEYSFPHHHRT